MPRINPKHWQRIEQFMNQVLELAPGERRAFIENIDDTDIAQQLARLLQAAEHPDPLLDSDAGSLLDNLIQPEPNAGKSQPVKQRRFGIYEVDRPLGQGGMGQVLLGHRDDGTVAQKVAIKLLHTGALDSSLRRRLLDEMQVLATLEHPGIVRFIDGGVNDAGLPYLVMEYCKGEPIDAWCRRTRPNVERRLQLVIDICNAVEHAHQHLVVHRDIKPSNILVDEDGCPKLLDFGVAKVIQGDAQTDSSTTRVFSPGYAAPEQITGAAITTATDVYALCVLLGELLWGRLPKPDPEAFRLDTPTLRWRKRLHASDRDEVRQLAQRRRLSSHQLQHLLRGDLARIVAKGLRTEPGQRYTSARALAEDVHNHLAHRPVLARNGGWAYRSRRFLRRNAMASSIAALAIFGMLGATGVALYQAQQAKIAAVEAGIQARRAGAVRDFLQSVFDAADPLRNQGKDIPVSQLLDAALQRSKTQLQGDPPVRAAVLLSLGQVLDHVGRQKDSAVVFKDAVQALESYASEPRDLAEALSALGNAEAVLNHIEAADPLLRRAVELTPMSAAPNAIGIEARNELGMFLVHQRHDPEACLALFDDLLLREQAILQLKHGKRLLAIALSTTSECNHAKGEYPKALSQGLRAVTLMQQAEGPESPQAAEAMTQVTQAFRNLARFKESEQYDRKMLSIFHRAYGDSHPATILAYTMTGGDLLRNGKFAEALEVFTKSREGAEELYGERHTWVARSYQNIGEAQRELGRFDAAAQNLRRGYQIEVQLLGPHHPVTAMARCLFARALGETGNKSDAEIAYRAGLADMRKGFGPEHPTVLRISIQFAQFLLHSGRASEAASLLDTARAGLLKIYQPGDIYPALAALYQGLAQIALKHPNAAQKLLQDSLPAVKKAGPRFQRAASEAEAALSGLIDLD